MLTILVLVRLAMGYEFQTIASASGQLVAEFGFSYAQVGALIGFFLLPGVVIAIPSGLMTRALDDRFLIIIGAAIMMAGSLTMGLGQSTETLYTGRLLTGVGGTIFNVLLTKMVTDWFAGHKIVFALAIMLAAWPGGIALGLLTQGVIADVWGWPWVMHAASLLAFLALLLTAGFYRDAQSQNGTSVNIRFLLPAREFVHMSVVGLGWAVYNAMLIIIVSFTPDHLMASGYATSEARAITSIVLWIAIIVLPIGGKLIEAIGRTSAAIAVSMIAAVLFTFALEQVIQPGIIVALVAVTMAVPGGALMALSAQAVRPTNRGPGLGIFYTWYYLGMAIAPVLAGWSRDITSDTGAPLLLAAALGLITVVTTLLLRLLQHTWPISTE